MTDDELKYTEELKAKITVLEAKLASAEHARDTYKNGFESQSRLHRAAADRLKKLSDVVTPEQLAEGEDLKPGSKGVL